MPRDVRGDARLTPQKSDFSIPYSNRLISLDISTI